MKNNRIELLSALDKLEDCEHFYKNQPNKVYDKECPTCRQYRKIGEQLEESTIKIRRKKRGIEETDAMKKRDEEVMEIRGLLKSGVSIRSVVDRYGVHPSTIQQIKEGRTYK